MCINVTDQVIWCVLNGKCKMASSFSSSVNSNSVDIELWGWETFNELLRGRFLESSGRNFSAANES